MDTKLQQILDQFLQNRETLRSAGVLINSDMRTLGAALMVIVGAKPDIDRIRASRSIIKRKTSVVSYFRGHVRFALECLLSLHPDGEAFFTEVTQSYKLLREKFWSSDYLPVAAWVLTAAVPKEERRAYVQAARQAYRQMREEHPLLTSAEDVTYAVLLAIRHSDISDRLTVAENVYRRLRGDGIAAQSAQRTGFLISLLGNDADLVCDRLLELRGLLKEAGCGSVRHDEVPVLALLAEKPEVKQTASQLIEVQQELRRQKGFKPFSMSRSIRNLYAGILVDAAQRADERRQLADAMDPMSIVSINTITAMLVAQQAAIMAALAASSTASAAAASASN